MGETCECCGEPAISYYPYGNYCKPCGEDVTHPTGFGWCFIEDGRKHRAERPADWRSRLTAKELRDLGEPEEAPRG